MIRTYVVSCVVLAAALPTAASGGSATGTLPFRAGVSTTWHKVACPAGTSATAFCLAIQGEGVVPGLGRVTDQSTYVVDDYTAPKTAVHFVDVVLVAGKGAIDISAATPSPVCSCAIDGVLFDFTVTGGTGIYAGAQGSGTVDAIQRATDPTKGWGTDSWSGTLTVPGYTFDTTSPVISGAASRSVTAPRGAKRARVSYSPVAKDPDEGSLPVTCTPRSGSFFKVGRTVVRCVATDANGNTGRASFTVTVRRG